MAASSSSAFLAMREENENQMRLLQQQPLLSSAPPASQPQASSSSNKKRRNQPDPDAEVIALSPKTLMATNRFVCEVCNKGFQREQNLQLHRRGHNLPWKLRQKSTKEVKRKVYLCPEPTCVHHDPARALGDLTGIKKHYSRKHGEKKYKCDKCSKKYAVHSDWKAHSKTCGTREYRCDCGTLFSRRDSFVTHRAFCDALAQESARNLNPPSLSSINGSHLLGLSQTPTGAQDRIHQPLSNRVMLSRPSPQFETLLSPGYRPSLPPPSPALLLQPQGPNHEESQSPHELLLNKPPQFHGLVQLPQLQMNINANSSSSPTASLFNLGFLPGNNNNSASTMDGGHYSVGGDDSTLFPSGNLTSIAVPSLYSTAPHAIQNHPTSAHMSATALLQRAAQLGSTTSNAGASSLLRSFGSKSSANHPSYSLDGHGFWVGTTVFGGNNGGSHLHDLVVNSIAGGGSSSSVFPGGYNDDQRQVMDEYRRFHGNGDKLGFDPQNPGGFSGSLEHAGRLTRDFLGVGEIVRSVREQQNGMDMMSSLDSQGKNAVSSQSQAFGGNNFQ